MNVLRTVKRHFPRIDEPTFLILYKAYVRPHFKYCIQAWSPYFKKDIECSEQVQRRATKLINGFKNLSYENRLKRLKLTTLEKRRLGWDLIETFKIITGREKVDKHEFFEISNNTHNLGGHQYKISVKRKRLTTRSAFFSQHVVNSWNRLPEAVVNATSINAFKNRLDRCNERGNWKVTTYKARQHQVSSKYSVHHAPLQQTTYELWGRSGKLKLRLSELLHSCCIAYHNCAQSAAHS